jgi:hypothetical protein
MITWGLRMMRIGAGELIYPENVPIHEDQHFNEFMELVIGISSVFLGVMFIRYFWVVMLLKWLH